MKKAFFLLVVWSVVFVYAPSVKADFSEEDDEGKYTEDMRYVEYTEEYSLTDSEWEEVMSPGGGLLKMEMLFCRCEVGLSKHGEMPYYRLDCPVTKKTGLPALKFKRVFVMTPREIDQYFSGQHSLIIFRRDFSRAYIIPNKW